MTNMKLEGWKGWVAVGLVALLLMLIANYITTTMVAKWINDESAENEQARLEEEEAKVPVTKNFT